MDSITVSKLSQKIKLLPDDLLQEVDKFIDFLNYKSENADWSEFLTDEQRLLIKKGSDDISQGKTYSHAAAKQIIKDHIKSKTS
ncbi:DUF2281 domain-containing protein [uncultured Flavobacterium sp.]|uniref:DUF2281 domain-containing protein n=1 Tax=uncultured Flavobacterium sp. TaxID=165435 RepID=UPI0025FFD90B|nr:DUF2281 domain-containing protein [uncultured Flavobacterium sp.]